jgi:xanthine dehydrogenase accessory factor
VKRAVLDAVLRALAEHRSVVLATDLASGESRVLEPFAADADGDPDLLAAARDAVTRDVARRLDREGGAVFLRPFNPPVRVVIVGAVHVAQPFSRMVQLAGYGVLVVDPRRTFATAERFPGVPLAAEWPGEALAKARLDRRSAVVALTHDPKIDDPAIEAALRSDAFYVGALGSQKTQAARRERLRQAGFGDADLARIHGPVGLAIGAVSPGEIAVSIMAELVGCLHPRRE